MNETNVSDNSASEKQIDLIDAEEFSTRLIELCLKKSRLSNIPRKQRDQHILLKSMTFLFDEGEDYVEIDVNRRLQVWLADIGRAFKTDHVNLRRWLVDLQYLERDNRGQRYSLAVDGPSREMFEPDVDDIDVYKTIGIGIKVAQEKRQEYMRRQDAG